MKNKSIQTKYQFITVTLKLINNNKMKNCSFGVPYIIINVQVYRALLFIQHSYKYLYNYYDSLFFKP